MYSMIKKCVLSVLALILLLGAVGCSNKSALDISDYGGIRATYRIKDGRQANTQEIETMVQTLKSRLNSNGEEQFILVEVNDASEINVTFELSAYSALDIQQAAA